MEFVVLLAVVNLMYSIETLAFVHQDIKIFGEMFRILNYRWWLITLGGAVGAHVIAVLMEWRNARMTISFLEALILGAAAYLMLRGAPYGFAWRYQSLFCVAAVIAYVRLSRQVKF